MAWGGAWEVVATDTVPSPRWGAATAVEAGRLWLYGGMSAGEPLGDTWALDLSSLSWEPVSTGPGVPGAAVAWDVVKGRLLRSGGEAKTTVWALTPGQGSWKSLGVLPGAVPPPVSGASLTAIPGGMVRLGGTTAGGQPGGAWLLDVTSLAWEELPGSAGAGRTNHAAVWDPLSGVVLVAGGAASTVDAFDPMSGTWATLATLPAAPGDRPPLILDPHSASLLLPAGAQLLAVTLDGGLTAAPPDDALTGAVGAYDQPGRRAVLFGGLGAEATSATRTLSSTCP